MPTTSPIMHVSHTDAPAPGPRRHAECCGRHESFDVRCRAPYGAQYGLCRQLPRGDAGDIPFRSCPFYAGAACPDRCPDRKAAVRETRPGAEIVGREHTSPAGGATRACRRCSRPANLWFDTACHVFSASHPVHRAGCRAIHHVASVAVETLSKTTAQLFQPLLNWADDLPRPGKSLSQIDRPGTARKRRRLAGIDDDCRVGSLFLQRHWGMARLAVSATFRGSGSMCCVCVTS